MKNSKHPYKIYHPAQSVEGLETHGQSWNGEAIKENIALCEYQTIAPALLRYLPKHGKILEAGCGLGRWVFYLKQRGFDIAGIDLAAEAVEIAKRYEPSVPVYLDDVLHTKYPDYHFDAVISLGVVEHFEEGPQEAFREVNRILKDNGLLFVSVPTQNLIRLIITNRLKELYWWYRKRKGEKYVFEEYRYTRKEFSSLLQEAKLESIEMIPDDFISPKNIGLYVDFPFFRHKNKKWELNILGRVFNGILSKLSPWFTCAGTFWVCKKIS
ncbi:MAG: methyltransferase domain-containing protein [Bacteroidetes bacterium]|nr:methyltransferase domain-containing protein [Bacteroidota bacterium]MBU1422045.1 methyltransferase domain-containing protein [Bacteroidota bacterium]